MAWGEVDEDNYYANVGAIMVFGPTEQAPEGEGRQFCSGTLIDPYIFLTAGHG